MDVWPHRSVLALNEDHIKRWGEKQQAVCYHSTLSLHTCQTSWIYTYLAERWLGHPTWNKHLMMKACSVSCPFWFPSTARYCSPKESDHLSKLKFFYLFQSCSPGPAISNSLQISVKGFIAKIFPSVFLTFLFLENRLYCLPGGYFILQLLPSLVFKLRALHPWGM